MYIYLTMIKSKSYKFQKVKNEIWLFSNSLIKKNYYFQKINKEILGINFI